MTTVTPTPDPPTPDPPSEVQTLETDVKTWISTKSSWVALLIGLGAGWVLGHFL